MTNIVTPLRGKMSEADYEDARAALRQTYGDDKRGAGVRFSPPSSIAAAGPRSTWRRARANRASGSTIRSGSADS